MVLTVRAVRGATDALSYDDATVSALARRLGVDWHTLWDAIEVEATARVGDPGRLQGVQVAHRAAEAGFLSMALGRTITSTLVARVGSSGHDGPTAARGMRCQSSSSVELA